MRYIYQIGRLERQMMPVEFEIEGDIFLSELSSFALKKYFKDEAKTILIYPLSLPFNKSLLNSNLNEAFKNKIKHILENRDDFFMNPSGLFKFHPHNEKCDDFIIIHAIGEFEGELFGGNFDDIVLEIFIEIIERYCKCGISELYIDVSSGHNIYVSALLEATRYFAVFNKLQSWHGPAVKIKLLFSDPIIGSSKQTYKIHKDYELKFKTFFSSPLDFTDINNSTVSRAIAKENRPFKNKIQRMLENFSLCFSALKNNTPLVLYSFDFESPEEVDALILEILAHAKQKLYSDWKNSPRIEKNEYLKSLYALSFYKGILLLMSQQEIYKKEEVSINEIKNKFKSLYKTFGLDLNIEILGHEIYNLTEGKDEQKRTIFNKAGSQWSRLSSYLYSGESKDFVKRNFLAHAGFERNAVEVRVIDNNLYLRYSPDALNDLKQTLIESM